jgi:predicted acylesterase/phospholipase RssA
MASSIHKISSLGFSGAGFLTAYHLGVAHAFVRRRIVDSSLNTILPVAGVSGGALVAAALASGIDMKEAMRACLDVSEQATCAGRLNVLQPGFSLIDCVETHLRDLLHASPGGFEGFQRRTDDGKRLRIGLTDVRLIRPLRRNAGLTGFIYVDQYRDFEDVIAASVLSSYIPLVTGPVRGSQCPYNDAVYRSTVRFQEMIAHGSVKMGETGETVTLELETDTVKDIAWDGGLVHCFPFFDQDTVIVSPLAVDFEANNSISPAIEYQGSSRTNIRRLQIDFHTSMHLTAANRRILRDMMFSSSDETLRGYFQQGYDNCQAFLDAADSNEVDNEAAVNESLSSH